MNNTSTEIAIHYPSVWKQERVYAHFPRWCAEFPDQFAEWEELKLGPNEGQFAQYYLMYLLRRDHGLCSIAWYKLCSEPAGKVNEKRTRKYWETMQRYMGLAQFEVLQQELKACGFTNFLGEPDLFCWHPLTREWFFAEAKADRDRLSSDQERWFATYRAALPSAQHVRVYRLLPVI